MQCHVWIASGFTSVQFLSLSISNKQLDRDRTLIFFVWSTLCSLSSCTEDLVKQCCTIEDLKAACKPKFDNRSEPLFAPHVLAIYGSTHVSYIATLREISRK